MERRRLLALCALLHASLLAERPLVAQDLLWERFGTLRSERMGYAVASIADVSGDSVRDVLAGAPDLVIGGTAGSVSVLSGVDGSVLGRFSGNVPGDCFGVAIAEVGDVDADGIVDVAIGAHQKALTRPAVGPGTVHVLSGGTLTALYTFVGSTAADRFGSSVAGGDLDGDGFSDVIVGAPGDFNLPGRVVAYSGATGAPLHTWVGDANDDRFGHSVTTLEDVDHDGRADVAVGAPQRGFAISGHGFVRVFSGATGSTLYSVPGDAAGDEFGWSVDGGADVDDDGCSDLAVGAIQFTDLCAPPGYVRLLSGADGSPLQTFAGRDVSDFFGASVCLGDDASGDGEADLLVGVPQSFTDCGSAGGPGLASLYSVRTGNELNTLDGSTPLDHETFNSGQFGFSVELAPDLDGDGIAELLVGGITEETGDLIVGAVRMYSGKSLYLRARPRSASTGAPVSLTTAEGAAGSPTLLAVTSINTSPTFLVLGGVASFGPDELRILAGNTPPGLAGNIVGFTSFAIGLGGAVVLSSEERVTFL